MPRVAYNETSKDDKAVIAAAFLRLDVNQSVTVYVAHDVRITPKPSWLATFTDTGQNLVTLLSAEERSRSTLARARINGSSIQFKVHSHASSGSSDGVKDALDAP